MTTHFWPQPRELRNIRREQLSEYVFEEHSICSVITYLREAFYYTDVTTIPEGLLSLKRFERAHNH